jgi:hypothetical protein
MRVNSSNSYLFLTAFYNANAILPRLYFGGNFVVSQLFCLASWRHFVYLSARTADEVIMLMPQVPSPLYNSQ